MKLLWCDNCHVVVCLALDVWKKCDCGRLGGQYNYDRITATIGGIGRVFGIANPFFNLDWWSKTEDEKKEFRAKYYPEGKGSDCWWGGYENDVQLFRIHNPDGPRLKVKVQKVKDYPVNNNVEITIVGWRNWWVGSEKRRKIIIIPHYDSILFTKKAQ